MKTINLGDIVTAKYNSGVYIGTVLEDRKNFWLVKVLAVITHPTQGDLHNPGHIDKGAFHERKALSYHEKMNARKRTTSLFEKVVPDYETSLFNATQQLKSDLQHKDTDYSRLALQKLSDLETHYYDF